MGVIYRTYWHNWHWRQWEWSTVSADTTYTDVYRSDLPYLLTQLTLTSVGVIYRICWHNWHWRQWEWSTVPTDTTGTDINGSDLPYLLTQLALTSMGVIYRTCWHNWHWRQWWWSTVPADTTDMARHPDDRHPTRTAGASACWWCSRWRWPVEGSARHPRCRSCPGRRDNGRSRGWGDVQRRATDRGRVSKAGWRGRRTTRDTRDTAARRTAAPWRSVNATQRNATNG